MVLCVAIIYKKRRGTCTCTEPPLIDNYRNKSGSVGRMVGQVTGKLTLFIQWRIGGGGLGGLNPPLRGFCFACQYIEIPADLDPNTPPPKNSGPQPPPPPPAEEFLDPPLFLLYIRRSIFSVSYNRLSV